MQRRREARHDLHAVRADSVVAAPPRRPRPPPRRGRRPPAAACATSPSGRWRPAADDRGRRTRSVGPALPFVSNSARPVLAEVPVALLPSPSSSGRGRAGSATHGSGSGVGSRSSGRTKPGRAVEVDLDRADRGERARATSRDRPARSTSVMSASVPGPNAREPAAHRAPARGLGRRRARRMARPEPRLDAAPSCTGCSIHDPRGRPRTIFPSAARARAARGSTGRWSGPRSACRRARRILLPSARYVLRRAPRRSPRRAARARPASTVSTSASQAADVAATDPARASNCSISASAPARPTAIDAAAVNTTGAVVGGHDEHRPPHRRASGRASGRRRARGRRPRPTARPSRAQAER